jgi:hypothetical protein
MESGFSLTFLVFKPHRYSPPTDIRLPAAASLLPMRRGVTQ